MQQLLSDSLNCITKNEIIRKLPVNNILKEAVLEQNNIGWDNWFKSRVALSLRNLFPKPVKKQSLLKQLLDHTAVRWKALWAERNDVVHGRAEGSISQQRKLRAIAELEYIYSRKHLYLLKDQERLFDSIENTRLFHCPPFKIGSC